MRAIENAANVMVGKTLALDSSHFGQYVRALNSRRADERRQAAEFGALLHTGGWVLAFSLHHLAEIYAHADITVQMERLDYIRSLPVVAYVRSSQGIEGGFGSVVNVLTTEIEAAIATGSADTDVIAAAAQPSVFSYASGKDVMRALDEAGPELGLYMRRQREQMRQVVAISQADVEKGPNLTLQELLCQPLRAPDEQESFLQRFGAKMTSEVVERGDIGIVDPITVAAGFTASVRQALLQVRKSGVHPIVYLLNSMGLRPEDLHEDARIEDLQRIAFYRNRASIAARGAGLDPATVGERVRAERLPSAIIGEAMARFGQQPRRRKGSVMNDVHLLCLSPYTHLTTVDKGTLANVERASARCPVFRSVIGTVARGRTYADLMPRLR